MTVTVRAATRDDARAIARVRVESWRVAYRGLISDAVLAALDAEAEGERRAARWSEFMVDARTRQLVAEVDGQVVGWAALGPTRDESRRRDGELFAIYALPDSWSRGVGHALMFAAEASLRASGYRRAHLWVLDGNDRAAAFYERHGWVEDGATKVDTSFVADTLHERRRVRDLSVRTAGG